jgi:hypothetical protein
MYVVRRRTQAVADFEAAEAKVAAADAERFVEESKGHGHGGNGKAKDDALVHP